MTEQPDDVSPYFKITVKMYGEAFGRAAVAERGLDRLREINDDLQNRNIELERRVACAEAKVEQAEALAVACDVERSKAWREQRDAEGPLAELWQAASALLCDVVGRSSGKTRREARDRLKAALKAAEPHVDMIPF